MKNVPTKYTQPKKTHTHSEYTTPEIFTEWIYFIFLAGLAIHATNPLSSCFGFYSKKKLPLCEAKSQTR